jgi:hypothetical protein
VSFVVVAVLLLKQILKRRSRIIRPQSRRSRSLLLPGHANLIQLALIPRILLRNPFLHRLHALEPAPRIEIRALFARMQLKAALRTLPIARRSLQHSSALRAARNHSRSWQIHGPWAHGMVPLRWTALAFRGRLLWLLPARLTVAVLISGLSIFRHNPSQARPVLSPPRTLEGKCHTMGCHLEERPAEEPALSLPKRLVFLRSVNRVSGSLPCSA